MVFCVYFYLFQRVCIILPCECVSLPCECVSYFLASVYHTSLLMCIILPCECVSYCFASVYHTSLRVCIILPCECVSYFLASVYHTSLRIRDRHRPPLVLSLSVPLLQVMSRAPCTRVNTAAAACSVTGPTAVAVRPATAAQYVKVSSRPPLPFN